MELKLPYNFLKVYLIFPHLILYSIRKAVKTSIPKFPKVDFLFQRYLFSLEL